MKTLWDLDLDGFEALRALIEASVYESLEQAIASLTVFSHPITAAQTRARAVFPIIRGAARRGEVEALNGLLIGYDDNTAPTEVFCWANGLDRRPRDLQFNHIYSRSTDPDCYTNLANLCISPSFLAKLTDTDPEIQAHLRYRSFELFGWYPFAEDEPKKPDSYDSLVWAKPMLAQVNLRQTLSLQVASRNN